MLFIRHIPISLQPGSDSKPIRFGSGPTANDMANLLGEHFSRPSYVFLQQVAAGGRIADALAIGRSSHAMHGFEIKISRQDWLAELERPEKSAPFRARCHWWWLVAPRGVATVREMPPGWGLIQFSGGKLRVVRAAPKMELMPFDAFFFTSLVSHFEKSETPRGLLRKAYMAGFEDGRQPMAVYDSITDTQSASATTVNELLTEWSREMNHARRKIESVQGPRFLLHGPRDEGEKEKAGDRSRASHGDDREPQKPDREGGAPDGV